MGVQAVCSTLASLFPSPPLLQPILDLIFPPSSQCAPSDDVASPDPAIYLSSTAFVLAAGQALQSTLLYAGDVLQTYPASSLRFRHVSFCRIEELCVE